MKKRHAALVVLSRISRSRCTLVAGWTGQTIGRCRRPHEHDREPRHIKLQRAVEERNWLFAAYELHEPSFARVTRYWPQWRHKPIAEMMTSVTENPMTALDRAIKCAGAAKLTAPCAQEACNTSHQSAEVGMIVIKIAP